MNVLGMNIREQWTVIEFTRDEQKEVLDALLKSDSNSKLAKSMMRVDSVMRRGDHNVKSV